MSSGRCARITCESGRGTASLVEGIEVFEGRLNDLDAVVWAANSTARRAAQEAVNPIVKPRNAANYRLFMNAAAAVAQGLDSSVVYYATAH